MRWRSRSTGASDGRSIPKAPASSSGSLRRAADVGATSAAPASVAVLRAVVVDHVPEVVGVGATAAGEQDGGRRTGRAAARSETGDERAHRLPAVVQDG